MCAAYVELVHEVPLDFRILVDYNALSGLGASHDGCLQVLEGLSKVKDTVEEALAEFNTAELEVCFDSLRRK